MTESRCCGCGVDLPDAGGPTHLYMLSSPACWAAYGGVSSRAYLDPQGLKVLQVQVDAYAVQHPAVMSVEQRSRWHSLDDLMLGVRTRRRPA